MTGADFSIFIVDGDSGDRYSLERLFEAQYPHVTTYASATDFLANFKLAHPCCLILDLRLPGMSGLELLAQLRGLQANIPSILVTGHADVPTTLRALRLGVVEVFPKPADARALLATVTRVLAADDKRHRVLQQVDEARRLLARLTPRERQLFELVIEGRSYKEMAVTLGISPRTVEHHRAAIAGKLGMDRVANMVRLGFFAGDAAAILDSGNPPFGDAVPSADGTLGAPCAAFADPAPSSLGVPAVPRALASGNTDTFSGVTKWIT